MNVDGMLTLDKQIRNIEKLTHEYPEDHRVWWLSIYQVISEMYNRKQYKFGEGNPERFLVTDYYRLISLLTETIKTIKISLSLAPPNKKHELGQCASKWLSSYLPYFLWAEDQTRLFNSYINDYIEACDESEKTYRAKSIAQKMPINEEQCLNLFEGTLSMTRRNDENYPVVTYSSPDADYISKYAAYFKALADEFSSL